MYLWTDLDMCTYHYSYKPRSVLVCSRYVHLPTPGHGTCMYHRVIWLSVVNPSWYINYITPEGHHENMNVSTYLVAQNVHGPRFTTPKFSLSNFTAKFSHINACLDRNRACFAIAKDGLAAHSKVVVPHFGPSFLTRSIPTVKTKDWLGLTCKLCRIGIPTRGSSSRWLSKFWYLSRVDAQYWKPITEYVVQTISFGHRPNH